VGKLDDTFKSSLPKLILFRRNQPAPTPGDQLPLPGSIAAKKDEERISTKRKLVDASDG